jgi:uncharacterized protein (DUF1330 family)
MSAYIIADIEITDPEDYQQYVQQVKATIAQYGGTYVVNGATSQPETLDGQWTPTRITVLAFPNVEQAKTWYDSPEYAAIRSIRHRASTSSLIVVHGA